MSEVIVITSGKGGVGKTTTVANIGTGLAAMGKKVAVSSYKQEDWYYSQAEMPRLQTAQLGTDTHIIP